MLNRSSLKPPFSTEQDCENSLKILDGQGTEVCQLVNPDGDCVTRSMSADAELIMFALNHAFSDKGPLYGL